MNPSRGESARAPRSADLLLVENDPRIVELLSWFLERRGHRVRAAVSFADARTRLLERRPELLLSDVDLGHENAMEQLPLLAAEGLLPPTLVVSGYVDRDLARRVMEIPGVLGVLAKPFEFARLERWIDDFLARAPARELASEARAP